MLLHTDSAFFSQSLRDIALAHEPVTLARALHHGCANALDGVIGLALYSVRPEARLQAVSGIRFALAEQLLAQVSEAPQQMGVVELDASLRTSLTAYGGQALFGLPLGEAAAPVGYALLLLSHPVMLAPALTHALTEQAAVAAAALKGIIERQALQAANEQLSQELATLREQLIATQEAHGKVQALTRALQQQLQQRRGRDALTDLISGRHFHSCLEVEVQRARRYRDELGLLLIDIDQFRRFNQNHSRDDGDQALSRLGEILRQELRLIDYAFRYGGEEFAVILPRCGAADLHKLADRLRQRVASERFAAAGESKSLTISIGAATYRQGLLVGSFVRRVDEALYQAKAQGRNRVVLADNEPP